MTFMMCEFFWLSMDGQKQLFWRLIKVIRYIHCVSTPNWNVFNFCWEQRQWRDAKDTQFQFGNAWRYSKVNCRCSQQKLKTFQFGVLAHASANQITLCKHNSAYTSQSHSLIPENENEIGCSKYGGHQASDTPSVKRQLYPYRTRTCVGHMSSKAA